MRELIARVTAELHVDASQQAFEDMFAKHRAQDRAFLAAQSIIAMTEIYWVGLTYRGRLGADPRTARRIRAVA